MAFFAFFAFFVTERFSDIHTAVLGERSRRRNSEKLSTTEFSVDHRRQAAKRQTRPKCENAWPDRPSFAVVAQHALPVPRTNFISKFLHLDLRVRHSSSERSMMSLLQEASYRRDFVWEIRSQMNKKIEAKTYFGNKDLVTVVARSNMVRCRSSRWRTTESVEEGTEKPGFWVNSETGDL